MNISWVLASDLDLDPDIDIEALKNLGSFWGSWKTWRSYQTDNVICSDFSRARELIDRGLVKKCNFYIPRVLYQDLDRPAEVKVFEGQYKDDVYNADDIISLHLAASQNDIVLLLGFNLAEINIPDKLQQHKWHVYHHLIRHAIDAYSDVQWVLVDHAAPVHRSFLDLPNFTQDQLSNVLSI